MFKRVALFLATNMAVMAFVSVILSVLQGVFAISGGQSGGLRQLLMRHPPLDERIAALRDAKLDDDVVRQGVVA